MKKNQSEDSKNTRPKKKINHKWLFLNASFAIIFVVIIIAGYLVIQNKSKESNDAKKINNTEMQNIAANANKLSNNGNVQDAAKVYEEAAKKTEDVDQKISILLSKSAVYFNNGNFDQALEIAKQAEQMKSTVGTADFIASIYFAKNDDKQAIIYYKKAISLLDKNSPTYESDTAYYNSKITNLSGGSTNE